MLKELKQSELSRTSNSVPAWVDSRIKFPLPCYASKIFGKYLDDNFSYWKSMFEQKRVGSGSFELIFDCQINNPKGANLLSAFLVLHGNTVRGQPNKVKEDYPGQKMKLSPPEGSVLVTSHVVSVGSSVFSPEDGADLLKMLINCLVIAGGVDPNCVHVIGYNETADEIYPIVYMVGDYLTGVGLLTTEDFTNIYLSCFENIAIYTQTTQNNEHDIENVDDFMKKIGLNKKEWKVDMPNGGSKSIPDQINSAMAWLVVKKRNPNPSTVIITLQSSPPMKDSYWLFAIEGKTTSDTFISGTISERMKVEIFCKKFPKVGVRLNDSLVDMLSSFVIEINRIEVFRGTVSEDIELGFRFLNFNVDPYLMYFFTKEFEVTD